MQLVIVDSKGVPHRFGNIEPWHVDLRTKMRSTARACMTSHGHSANEGRQRLVWTNCAACVLERGLKKFNPNYGGWLRVYIQNGIDVPADVILKELKRAEKLEPYRAAILADLVTFPHKHRGVVYC